MNGEEITSKQLDAVVDHFRDEAELEGRSFPADDSAEFKQLRNDQLLGLLIYRTELKQSAERLGVKVDEAEVSRRLASASANEEEESSTGDPFPRDSIVAQLRLEGISDKVTRNVKGSTQAELSARKNKRIAEFLERMRREAKVRYEPGYAPGP